jgi:hypothetical protein
MQKGFIVLLIYAVLITIGFVVAVVYIAGLFSSNNDLIRELAENKQLRDEARKAELIAEQRNSELEAQLKAALGTSGEIAGTASGISLNQRRIESGVRESAAELGGLRNLLTRIGEENNLTAN